LQKKLTMSEQELNSYRLTSMTEPTDEMLEQIMHEIAADVRKENIALRNRRQRDLDRKLDEKKKIWANRITPLSNANQ